MPKWVEESGKDKREHLKVLATLTGVDAKLLIASYEEGHSAGARLVLDRLEKTREKDGNDKTVVYSVYGTGINAAIAMWGYAKGRESVRKEVLDDQP